MLIDEINDLWDARPFRAFEIAMTDGSVFIVTSPKLMLISPSQRTLHLVTPQGRSHFLSLSQMTRVSLLDIDKEATTAPA